MIDRLTPWMFYPATMTLCVGLYLGLQAQGMALQWAMLLPACLDTALVTVLERRFTLRLAWHPDRTTTANTLAYMTRVALSVAQAAGSTGTLDYRSYEPGWGLNCAPDPDWLRD